ncbi:MAG: outer membrane protein OmpA-like peptidoglycan-associated protein [Saprospiraceae bacterium]|jgi:outer membrane protein OmpA-like peptidoglycan-associated protein
MMPGAFSQSTETVDTGTSAEKHNLQIFKLLAFMQENPNSRLFIGGHSDTSEDATENLAPSQDRAEQVHLYLIKNGINTRRIVSMGFGSTKPIVPNDTANKRNRHVSVTVLN